MSKFVNKSKKNKDPYPITDTYQVAYNLVDAATVTVTDLCENLSNNFDTHDEGIVDEMTNVDTRKFNSVSVSNGADGAYPVWLGVDKFHKVRKIFANTNESNTSGYFDDKNKMLQLLINSKENLSLWWDNKQNLENRKKFLKEFANSFRYSDLSKLKKLV